jgi:hypothetical protein
MVLPAARRFTELGVNPKQPLPTMQSVEPTPRDLSNAVPPDEPSNENLQSPADEMPDEQRADSAADQNT